ncbi:MAG: ribonuclease R, partial [Bacteroidia bacterium]|nr:ribonuclease R [Bacteroidia bacterium]
MAKKFIRKKQGVKKSYLFEEILKVLAANPNKALNYKQIAADLNITDHSQRLLINAILEELKTNNNVTEPERGKFKLKSIDKFITGKVDMTSSGTAYVVSEETESDTFISQRKTLNALHGDLVKVKLYPTRKGKQEGEIIEIVERLKTEFVGTIQLSPKFAFLVPSNNRIHVDIYIPLEKLNGAKDGQKAIARIVEWGKNSVNPIGEIIEVLGNVGDNNTE